MSDARGQSCVRFATQLPIWEGRPPPSKTPQSSQELGEHPRWGSFSDTWTNN